MKTPLFCAIFLASHVVFSMRQVESNIRSKLFSSLDDFSEESEETQKVAAYYNQFLGASKKHAKYIRDQYNKHLEKENNMQDMYVKHLNQNLQNAENKYRAINAYII